MLTDSQIKSLKPRNKAYRVADGGGLYLEVKPNGKKTFRQSYRMYGKARTHTHGDFPAVKLAAARRLREELKHQIKFGIDPNPVPEPKKAAVAENNTWREFSRQYLEKRRREGAAEATMNKLTLHAEVLNKVMGDMPVREIGAKPVIEACRTYEEKGMLNSATAVRSLASQVFRFAIAHGEADYDPASAARDAIAKPKDVGYSGVTDPRRVGELMQAIDGFNGNPVVRLGLFLSAYLFPRNGELRRMEWSHIDGSVWVCPAEIMKKKREHLVPLPRQAQEALRHLREINGSHDLVLHSTRSSSSLISENTFNNALRQIGFGPDEHVHHGFRITASTTLYENDWNGDWIERQLAHVEENRIKGAYNKAQHLEGRADMMQWYADWLDERSGVKW